jgi:hypothetical protein
MHFIVEILAARANDNRHQAIAFIACAVNVNVNHRMSIKSTGKPMVGIIMGSDSDWPSMKAAAEACAEFGVPHDWSATPAVPGSAGCALLSPVPVARLICPA